MNFWSKYKNYIIFIAVTLLVGGLAGFISSGSMRIFDSLEKPKLSPPGFVFPIVWTILYTLMGISAAMIYEAKDKGKNKALLIYGLQLFFNFAWSIIFFNTQMYLLAFIWLLILLVLIILMIVKFYEINKKAAFLQIPYLIWVTFAGYLNLMIYLLNK